MAAVNFIRFALHGSGQGEEFNTNFVVKCENAIASEADLSTILDAAETSMNSDESPSAWATLCALLNSAQTYDRLSAYFYALGGEPAVFLHHKSVSHPGTSPSLAMIQQCIVVTLNSSRSGASYRGRMYLPASGIAVDASLHYGQVKVDSAALGASNAMLACCSAVRAHGGGDGSRVVIYSPTKALLTEVSGLSVDNKPDVQRRRAMSMPSVRTTYTGPNPPPA